MEEEAVVLEKAVVLEVSVVLEEAMALEESIILEEEETVVVQGNIVYLKRIAVVTVSVGLVVKSHCSSTKMVFS